jgi:hypothetical protein
MSLMNQGETPGFERGHSGRPGRMTAAMRAMRQASGPSILRIGIVVQGRILEERIVKQRTSVTVGPSEKSTFVIQANLPSQFKLFEFIGNEYYLNFLDGMTGRVALATDVSDLAALRGRAKRIGSAHQIRLTLESRGKIVVGETTLLFQFVAAPPAQVRPQLPLSVKNGVVSQIDWRLSIIAALSFLLHFGLVGGMYSDWMDRVIDDDITAGFIDTVQKTMPPPVEVAGSRTSSPAEPEPAPVSTRAPQASSEEKSGKRDPTDAKHVADLLNEAERTKMAILGVLSGGSNIDGVIKDSAGAPVDLGQLAKGLGGISNEGASGLNLPSGAGGAIRQGFGVDRLPSLRGGETCAACMERAGQATKVVPIEVQTGATTMSVPINNAEATIRSQIMPGAKRCYQRGLETDPSQAGKLVILIKVAPSGEVDSANPTTNTGLSAAVANCISRVAASAKFDPPGAAGSTIVVPFSFLKQTGD